MCFHTAERLRDPSAIGRREESFLKRENMTVSELANKMGLRVLVQGNDSPVTDGYVSDLLSDVIANAEEGYVWITVQRHLNIIAVAQLKKMAAILLPRGDVPDAVVLDRAGKQGLFVLQGDTGAFELCGRLFALLHPPA